MTVLVICLIAFNRGHLSTALLVRACAIVQGPRNLKR